MIPRVTIPTDAVPSLASQNFRAVIQRLKELGLDAYLRQQVKDALKNKAKNGFNKAQTSDQEQTPPKVDSILEDRLWLSKSAIYDLVRYNPDWNDIDFIDALIEEYPDAVLFLNPPFS